MPHFTKLIYFLLFLLNNHSFFMEASNEPKQNLVDMRTTCLANKTRDVFLSFGKGQLDSVIILVSFRLVLPQCSLNIYTFSSNNLGIIVVMEFFRRYDQLSCKNNIFIVKNEYIIDICGAYTSNVYKQIFVSNNISISFNGKEKNTLNNVKVTVTTARISSNMSCDNRTEISCILKNNAFCVNKQLQCDGNINCGEAEKYDEDNELCNVLLQQIGLVVSSSTCMLLTIVFVCYRIIMKCCITPNTVQFVAIAEVAIKDNIENRPVTFREDSAKISTNQITGESSLLLSLFAVSEESESNTESVISQSNPKSTNSSQLFSSFKESEFSVIRNVNVREKSRKKLVQPKLTEGKMKTLRGSGEPEDTCWHR